MLKTLLKHHRRPRRLLIVKKVQRSFAVEYKSDLRKLNSQPNSIWGDINLKSVAQDVQDAAMPFLPAAQDSKTGGDVSLPEEPQVAPLLTLRMGQETNAAALQGTIMAVENDTMTDADTPAAGVPFVSKKKREPRAKEPAADMTSIAVLAELSVASSTADGKQKRGRKTKSDEAMSAKRLPSKHAPKTVQAAAATSTVAIDEIADLLQLEEENQRLRKLLAEKLRAENADLRKRLNLA
jgi:hypothetical protein